MSNGDQVNTVAALAMRCNQSVDFTGYWQRHNLRINIAQDSMALVNRWWEPSEAKKGGVLGSSLA